MLLFSERAQTPALSEREKHGAPPRAAGRGDGIALDKYDIEAAGTVLLPDYNNEFSMFLPRDQEETQTKELSLNPKNRPSILVFQKYKEAGSSDRSKVSTRSDTLLCVDTAG